MFHKLFQINPAQVYVQMEAAISKQTKQCGIHWHLHYLTNISYLSLSPPPPPPFLSLSQNNHN